MIGVYFTLHRERAMARGYLTVVPGNIAFMFFSPSACFWIVPGTITE